MPSKPTPRMMEVLPSIQFWCSHCHQVIPVNLSMSEMVGLLCDAEREGEVSTGVLYNGPRSDYLRALEKQGLVTSETRGPGIYTLTPAARALLEEDENDG